MKMIDRIKKSFARLSHYATNKRFVYFCVMPNIAFLIVANLTDSVQLIPILSLIVEALSVAVCVAFFPNVLLAVWVEPVIKKGDLLALGIWLAFFAIVLRTAQSLAWRWMGEPSWMVNTDFTSYFLFLTICAAVFHIAVPGSVDERIPPLRWIKIGIWIAGAVFIGLCVVYASDIRNSVRHLAPPHDEVPGPTSYVRPI